MVRGSCKRAAGPFADVKDLQAAICKAVGTHASRAGYNAAADRYEDLIAAGVIDPTKVVRVALQNAASVASLMLTTEAVIAQHSTTAEKFGG